MVRYCAWISGERTPIGDITVHFGLRFWEDVARQSESLKLAALQSDDIGTQLRRQYFMVRIPTINNNFRYPHAYLQLCRYEHVLRRNEHIFHLGRARGRSTSTPKNMNTLLLPVFMSKQTIYSSKSAHAYAQYQLSTANAFGCLLSSKFIFQIGF